MISSSSNQTVFVEYIMLDGVNDQEQHAHQLGKLLENLKSVGCLHILYWYNLILSLFVLYWLYNFWQVVNLIPFNPIGTSSIYKTSSDQNVKKFQKIVRGIYNIRTTIRQEMGQDISGACGQLVVNLSEQRAVGGASLLTDIEDLRI